MPAKVGSKTTYTVTLTTTQPTNAVENAEVRGNLPSNVRWMGATSPANEDVAFIPERNEVVWRIGRIDAAATSTVPRTAAFQIEFEPAFNQARTQPVLVDNIVFTGTDSFTSQNISITGLVLTTSLSTDPTYSSKDGAVRE